MSLYQTESFSRVAELIRKKIETELISIGFLCRVFGRGKTSRSLEKKIRENPGKYTVEGKLIQDGIGIRIILYFVEDIKIVHKILCEMFDYDKSSSTIDIPNNNTFSVSRYNLIFRLPPDYFRDISEPTSEFPVDRAFEIQIRTILSEGWHEVEHDLRYKRKNDWKGSDDLSRNLNGVLATLETSEWSMWKILDDLSYKHYKQKNWDALIHSTLRMRLSGSLNDSLCNFFKNNPDSARKLVRIDRAKVIYTLSKISPRIPLTSDNMIFVWNAIYLKDNYINDMTPPIILEYMSASDVI